MYDLYSDNLILVDRMKIFDRVVINNFRFLNFGEIITDIEQEKDEKRKKKYKKMI